MTQPLTPSSRFWRPSAVLLGVATDFVSTVVVQLLLSIVAGTVLASRGLSPQQVQSGIEAAARDDPLFAFAGLACSALGGYVAAHLAPGRELPHAFAAGAASILIGLPIIALELANNPKSLGDPTRLIIVTLLVLPCAALGGYIRLKQPRETPPSSSSGPWSDGPPIPKP